MIAVRKLKQMGWAAMILMAALLLYPLSLQVATVRSDLKRVDSEILDTRRDIAYLEAELRARGNFTQLNDWNELLYGYEAPRPSQYLDNERDLAALTGGTQASDPVLISDSGGDDTAQLAGIIGSPVPTAADAPRPVAAPSAPPTDSAPEEVESFRRTERLASMESRLLGEDAASAKSSTVKDRAQ